MEAHQLFESELDSKYILHGDQLKNRYSHIWRMDEPLKANCLLLPTSTEEVSAILKICNDNKLNVVTHGGLTNLVGSTKSENQDVILSLERMNRIIEINENTRTATVEAGVILENLHNAAEDVNLQFPLNFGAKGSAQIGGVISTNAGGLRVLKYGMTRQLVLGLEYVLADGTIISSLKTIIKDNSGYDLKQLMIGSEGTLGLITKAVLKLVEKPTSRQAAIAGLSDYANVMRLLKKADAHLSGKLSGFELMWNNTFKQLTAAGAHVRPPLELDHKFYVLLESQGNDDQTDQQELEKLLENMLIEEIVDDAVVASSLSEVEHFFRIREDVSNLTDHMKYDQHFDISLPIPAIDSYIAICYERLEELDEVDEIYAFGHVADGNIHLMIGKQNDRLNLKKEIDHIVYEGLTDLNGSVSAEHGIGVDKRDYLNISNTTEEIELMKLLKKTLDPNSILNRGKIFEL